MKKNLLEVFGKKPKDSVLQEKEKQRQKHAKVASIEPEYLEHFKVGWNGMGFRGQMYAITDQ